MPCGGARAICFTPAETLSGLRAKACMYVGVRGMGNTPPNVQNLAQSSYLSTPVPAGPELPHWSTVPSGQKRLPPSKFVHDQVPCEGGQHRPPSTPTMKQLLKRPKRRFARSAKMEGVGEVFAVGAKAPERELVGPLGLGGNYIKRMC